MDYYLGKPTKVRRNGVIINVGIRQCFHKALGYHIKTLYWEKLGRASSKPIGTSSKVNKDGKVYIPRHVLGREVMDFYQWRCEFGVITGRSFSKRYRCFGTKSLGYVNIPNEDYTPKELEERIHEEYLERYGVQMPGRSLSRLVYGVQTMSPEELALARKWKVKNPKMWIAAIKDLDYPQTMEGVLQYIFDHYNGNEAKQIRPMSYREIAREMGLTQPSIYRFGLTHGLVSRGLGGPNNRERDYRVRYMEFQQQLMEDLL